MNDLEWENKELQKTIDDIRTLLEKAFPEFKDYPDYENWSIDELVGMVIGDADYKVGIAGLRAEIDELNKMIRSSKVNPL